MKQGDNSRLVLLRECLDRIVELDAEETVACQIALVAKLGEDYPHTISPLEPVTPAQRERSRYNCYQYAFRIERPPEAVCVIARRYRDVYPGGAFVCYLIDRVLEEVRCHEVRDRDVVVYFSDDQIRHAGRLSGNRVRSKWGCAHLWEHGVFEVPQRYGTTVRFFRGVSRDAAADAFVLYAKQEVGAADIDRLVTGNGAI